VTALYWITARNSVKNCTISLFIAHANNRGYSLSRDVRRPVRLLEWFHSRNKVGKGNTLIQHPKKIWLQWLTALFGQMPLCKSHRLIWLSWPRYSTWTSFGLLLVDPLTLDKGWEGEATGLYLTSPMQILSIIWIRTMGLMETSFHKYKEGKAFSFH